MTIAVSACLLGEKVRFDGGHKHFRFLTDSLAEYATFVPFCPEHLAFGTPRPSIRLVHDDTHAYVLSNKTGGDVTAALAESVQTELARLRGAPLTGISFKAKSPSCGFGRAKMHLPNGHTYSAAKRPFPCCRWRRRHGCRTHGCGRTSSCSSSPTTLSNG